MNRFNLTYYQATSNATLSGTLWSFTFTGKERDEETGYGYFGARYMDHELMTMWLSVDPMADKYPGLSPYNYCAWNPVELVDPDGRDNVNYLVDLQKQKNIDVDKLINRANEVLESLGLNTRVRLAPDGKFFDPQFMDPTDSYAVLGDIGEVKEFISKYNPEYCDESFNEFTGFANSPEWAANEYFDKADAIGLSSKGIVDCATNFLVRKMGLIWVRFCCFMRQVTMLD